MKNLAFPISDDECIIMQWWFKYKHHVVVKNDPSLSIVVDLIDGVNPYAVAEIGLKVLAEAIVKEATMEDVNKGFQHIFKSTRVD